MSNVYYIVDLQRKAFLEFMDGEIKTNCTRFLQNMKESFEKAPGYDRIEELQQYLMNYIDSHMERLSGGYCLPGVLNESLAIGTRTPHQFFWRRDNGFQSYEDVEKYLKEHTYCKIFDADQVEVSLDQFKAVM